MIMETEITDFRITLRGKTTIRDQGMIIRIAIYMMKIEIKMMIRMRIRIKMMIRMRVARRVRWKEDHLVKNK